MDQGLWTMDNRLEISDMGHGTLDKQISIDTYNDHRMAMAFSLLSMCFDDVDIKDEQVVSKSYPNFWVDLGSMGFLLSIGYRESGIG